MNEIVYRCENKNKVGPYITQADYYNERYNLLDHHSANSKKWPTPWQDGISGHTGSMKCGFVSIEQLTKWFNKTERNLLRQWGWKFFKLEVSSEISIGNHQCMFYREDAKIIEEIEI